MIAQVSVVFVDVRGFTAMSEKVQPTTAVARLNRFYNLAAQSVFDLDGTLDKMVGDQVMAFFGAPFRPEDHPARAVQSALEIVAGAQSSEDVPEGLPLGGGVACGEVFMGNVGEGEVRDFTIIGDTVNTAAWLQAMAGPGEVLVTDDTYKALSSTMVSNISLSEQRTLELKRERGSSAGPRPKNRGSTGPNTEVN